MGAYENAINAIADFPTTYVVTAPTLVQSFRPENIPEKLNEGDFPCAVCYGDLNDGDLMSETFGGGGQSIDMEVEQHIYWDLSSTSLSIAFPAMNRFWGNYLAAIKAYPFYGPDNTPPLPVHSNPKIKFSREKVVVGDFEFHTIVLKHKVKVFL